MRQYMGMVVLLFLGLSSCLEPIDIPVPEQTPQAVAIANFNPDDFIRVFVSREKSVNSTDSTIYITDASVGILLNDRVQGRFTFVPAKGEYPNAPYYRSNFKPRSGRSYTLAVEIPDNPPLLATNSIPTPVPIEEIEVDSVVVDYPFLDRTTAVYTFFGKIKIFDPPGVDNFYHLAEVLVPIDWYSLSQGDTCCIQFNRDTIRSPVSILDSQDPAFLALIQEDGFVFTDRDFDGEAKRIPYRSAVTVNTGFELVSRLQVELRSVSGDYYRYHSSFTRQLAARESPLAEPVIIFDNVENGLGNFSGYSIARDSVSLAR